MHARLTALPLLLLLSSLAAAQSPHDWHYHGLPNGPTAPGVHAVLGHHRQSVPFYSPRQTAETFGPRPHLQYGWFGRFAPSPRPRPLTVQSRAPDGR